MDDGAAGEGVDPRVKDQLEFLNSYTDEINSLELQLDDANATFRNTLSEYSQRLKQLAKKLGKCVQVARPYYEAEEVAKKAKLECEEAAVKYHRACGIHKEARETISVAEKKFNAKKDDWEFDAAWQEMLNRETIKVMNAESMKEESEKEHEKKTRIFSAAVQQVKVLENQLKKDIIKSRPYFEQKAIFLKVLQDLKHRVESLQNAVMDSKAAYANCLHNLEMISKEIHERRKLLLQPREPGVGAEQDHKPNLDFSNFPQLGNLDQSDKDSIFADSLSSTSDPNPVDDDLKDNSLKSSPFVPTLNLPLLEVTSRQVTVSESNLYTPAQLRKSLDASDVTKLSANTSLSGDCFLPETTTTVEQYQPSKPSPVICSDDDAFEEVDLTHD